MKFDKETLDGIFAKTNGRCHLCHGDLTRSLYGDTGAKKGWEVEHSKPQALGGTHHMNNLFPAHVSCNRSKGTTSAAEVREENGVSGPPMSAERIEKKRGDNAATGAGVGAVGGVLLFGALRAAGMALGPVGFVVTTVATAALGAAIGSEKDPEK